MKNQNQNQNQKEKANLNANVPTQKGSSAEPGYMHLYEFGELNDMKKKIKVKKQDKQNKQEEQ